MKMNEKTSNRNDMTEKLGNRKSLEILTSILTAVEKRSYVFLSFSHHLMMVTFILP